MSLESSRNPNTTFLDILEQKNRDTIEHFLEQQPSLTKDKDLAVATVRIFPGLYPYFTDFLEQDDFIKEVVVAGQPTVLAHIKTPESGWSDGTLTSAVKQNGEMLKYGTDEQKDNPSIVKFAAGNRIDSMVHASKRLQAKASEILLNQLD